MQTHDEEIDTLDGGKMIKHGNDAPAWMVTYADLMSLLFALFVLILSFADVNSESFKQNAGPMREAFNQNSDFQTDEEAHRTGGLGILQGVRTVPMNVPEEEVLQEAMVAELRRSLSADIASHLVELEEAKNGVVLRFPSETYFVIGGAELSTAAFGTLDKIIPVLAKTPGDIKVGGHTDDVPISTAQFRSNWDLSTARANSVVHYILQTGKIAKERLTSQGYGDSRPLYENVNADSRAANRRVEITIEIPENLDDAKNMINNLQAPRRVWSIDPGQKQIQQGAEPVEKSTRTLAPAQSPETMADQLNRQSGAVVKQDLKALGQ